MQIIPEAAWSNLIKELTQTRGTSFIIGETDSGKSSLATYLIRKLISIERRLAYIDADIGQSTLGVPGTIGMQIVEEPRGILSFVPDMLSFIGTLDPASRIPQVINSTKKMAGFAKGKGIRTIIVDTSGLVSGDRGRELKNGKIRAIKPNHIIALQRHDELEHILSSIEGFVIHRIKPSRFIKRKSKKARIHYRGRLFSKYFKASSILRLPLSEIAFFSDEKLISIQTKEIEKGTLVGLNHAEETIDVGFVKGISEEEILIKTPLQPKQRINRIIIGDIII